MCQVPKKIQVTKVYFFIKKLVSVFPPSRWFRVQIAQTQLVSFFSLQPIYVHRER
jgi:hypothetical protein